MNNLIHQEEKRIRQVNKDRARIKLKIEELLPHYLKDYTSSKYKDLIVALLELNVCLTWEQMHPKVIDD